MNAETDRNPLLDIAGELLRLGEDVSEGDYNRDELRDRLWALSRRLNPYNPQDQVRRVGVIVFCEVRATSDRDAGTVAEMALRQVAPPGTIVPTRTMRPEPVPVRVGQAMEVGMAAGNGYTWPKVTSTAWRYGEAGGPWDGAMPETVENGDSR